jgi:hypothetical protein
MVVVETHCGSVKPSYPGSIIIIVRIICIQVVFVDNHILSRVRRIPVGEVFGVVIVCCSSRAGSQAA